ncbi:hypothetical protein [Streptomyces olivaceus]|uniref:hypothetical protein n=1 Tax=Streptomyces olivaceus TaxID=47716 RepID=UPI00370FB395
MIEIRVFADVLIKGLDDCVLIDQLIWDAKEEIRGNHWKRFFTELLHYLLEGDLIQVGELTAEGFSPWVRECAEIVQSVLDDLDRLSWEPELGSRVWITNTGAGNDTARLLID